MLGNFHWWKDNFPVSHHPLSVLCMCVHRYVCPCINVWRSEIDIRGLLLSLSFKLLDLIFILKMFYLFFDSFTHTHPYIYNTFWLYLLLHYPFLPPCEVGVVIFTESWVIWEMGLQEWLSGILLLILIGLGGPIHCRQHHHMARNRQNWESEQGCSMYSSLCWRWIERWIVA